MEEKDTNQIQDDNQNIEEIEATQPIEEIENSQFVENTTVEVEEASLKEENNEINLELKDEINHEEMSEMVTVRPVKFQEFESSMPIRAIKRNLDIMQDVSMHVSVELGKTKSSIREVMELETGSVVELEKIAGEQVEIYANDKLIAKGEVIVIEDNFGVRVTSTNVKQKQND